VNPLIIILGIAALYYVPTFIAALNLTARIKSIVPIQILENSITLQVGLFIKNNSSFRITLNSVVCDVLFNGTKIGEISQTINKTILSNTENVVYINFQITPDNLGIETWRDVLLIDLQNTVISLNGTLQANNKKLPFTSNWTMENIGELLGVKN